LFCCFIVIRVTLREHHRKAPKIILLQLFRFWSPSIWYSTCFQLGSAAQAYVFLVYLDLIIRITEPWVLWTELGAVRNFYFRAANLAGRGILHVLNTLINVRFTYDSELLVMHREIRRGEVGRLFRSCKMNIMWTH
jgi:hypothetical protein